MLQPYINTKVVKTADIVFCYSWSISQAEGAVTIVWRQSHCFPRWLTALNLLPSAKADKRINTSMKLGFRNQFLHIDVQTCHTAVSQATEV